MKRGKGQNLELPSIPMTIIVGLMFGGINALMFSALDILEIISVCAMNVVMVLFVRLYFKE